MQKMRVLENDNYKHIKGVYDSICFGGDYVEVRLYRLNEFDEFLKEFVALERTRIEVEKCVKNVNTENTASFTK